VDHTVLPANHTTPAFTRSSPGGATTEWTVIAPADEAYYSAVIADTTRRSVFSVAKLAVVKVYKIWNA